MPAPAPPVGRAPAPLPAPVAASPADAADAAAAAPPAAAGPAAKKRRVSILDTMKAEFKVVAPQNDTAVDDRVKDEISKFEALKSSVAVEDKYTKGGIFDLCAFYNDRAPQPSAHPLHSSARACVVLMC